MDCSMYEIISKKRDGKALSQKEIRFFIRGYVSGDIPDYQAAALLMAIYLQGMNSRELSFLTETMIRSGERFSLAEIPGKKVDKHSTGGVGDKVSFIVSPLAAACGIKVPMLSGRGLGHTGGTLDKLESIPGMNVSLTPETFKRVLADVGMVICGQTENIVPADKKIYALRDATATIGSIPLITASIMSKKLALETDGIVLDVKTGRGAFMPGLDDALRLCETMVETGEKANRKTIGIITNMDQPLGKAVGNSLEIIESIEALKGNGPDDLMEVCFAVAAGMLAAGEVTDNPGTARKLLTEALSSGRALKIFREFITAQGGDARVCENYDLLPQSKCRVFLKAETGGFVSEIDALEVGRAAVDIGAGRRKKEDNIDHAAGFVFNKKIGDRVKIGDLIVTVHAGDMDEAECAKERLKRAVVISSGRRPQPSPPAHVVGPEMIRFNRHSS
ncbi:MAG: thymidine phosphorylase [Candidatus Aminicenantes bacterium]|nr:thymidine phosphorylase [Candidatus Aminicenantes bacterium]